MYRTAYSQDGSTVFYLDSAGNKYATIGGSLAWRLNNPGLVHNASRFFSRQGGSIGRFGRYAIFATPENGREALSNWLHDIWTIVNQFQIKPEKIAPVIKDVFQNRKTVVREIPKAFSEAFYNMPKTLERWDAFLKGIGHDPVPLEKMIFEIRDFFLPILPENGAQITGINS